MQLTTRLSQLQARKGIALIAVLWVVAFLSMMLMVTLMLLKVDTDENIAEVQNFMAWQQAHEGLSLGLHPQIKRDDPILFRHDEDYDDGYEVTVTPESTKLNINYIVRTGDNVVLVELLRSWGLEDSDADQLVAAISDWVDPDGQTRLNGAESDFYKELGFSDRPYNRTFRNLDELTLVRGFSVLERLRPNWRDSFTLWSTGRLDMYETPPELLAIAAEVDQSNADSYHAYVLGDDMKMGTDDDMSFGNVNEALDELNSPMARREQIAARFRVGEDVVRVESVGKSGKFRSRIVAIVEKRAQSTRILDYKEDRRHRE